MSLTKPRHLTLGKEFLETFLNFLAANDYILNNPINQIIYDDEEFYITEIKITNKPLNGTFCLKNKTYLDKWSQCDNSEPVPESCHCNSDIDDETGDDTDDDTGNDKTVDELISIQ